MISSYPAHITLGDPDFLGLPYTQFISKLRMISQFQTVTNHLRYLSLQLLASRTGLMRAFFFWATRVPISGYPQSYLTL